MASLLCHTIWVQKVYSEVWYLLHLGLVEDHQSRHVTLMFE